MHCFYIAPPADGLAAYTEKEGCADLLCRFLDLLTREDAADADWAAAAGNDTALRLVRNGVLTSFGSDGLKAMPAGGTNE